MSRLLNETCPGNEQDRRNKTAVLSGINDLVPVASMQTGLVEIVGTPAFVASGPSSWQVLDTWSRSFCTNNVVR